MNKKATKILKLGQTNKLSFPDFINMNNQSHKIAIISGEFSINDVDVLNKAMRYVGGEVKVTWHEDEATDEYFYIVHSVKNKLSKKQVKRFVDAWNEFQTEETKRILKGIKFF